MFQPKQKVGDIIITIQQKLSVFSFLLILLSVFIVDCKATTINLIPVFVGGKTTSHYTKLSSIKYSGSILNDHLSHADGDQYGV